MIKNLIFDFGGVIVDISRSEAVKRFETIGVANAGELLDKYHQKGIFLEVEEGRTDAGEFCRKLGEIAGKEISFEESKWAWLGFITGVPRYRLDYLLELKQSYNLYILSNTNPFIMSWARSPEFTSEGRPLDDYFHKLYLSYRIGIVKPHREIFDYMIRDASLVPSETVFIDDGDANIEMGKALGFKTLKAVNCADWRNELRGILAKD